MSEDHLSLSHDSPALKKHKKKKRHRDEAQDDGDERVEKKRRKHGESSVDTTVPVDTERKKKKKKKKEKAGEADVSAVEANLGAATEKKKKAKRKPDSGSVEIAPELAPDTGGEAQERKKKKRKHRDAADPILEAGQKDIEGAEGAGTTVELTSDITDLPPKKKNKSKGKEKAFSSNAELNPTASSSSPVSVATDAPSRPPPENSSLFPLPNYIAHPPYYPRAQTNMPLFPTLNDLSFPDLALGSNEDVLRALQDIDLSKITGVLKTLSDAADAANISLIPTSSAPSRRGPVVSTPRQGPSGSSKDKRPRRPVATTMLPSSSEPQTRPDHANLLATKWMLPSKLAELVKNEGLVYKKGKFSPMEVKQVNEAIEKYRATRDLSEADLNRIIWPSDSKEKDTAFWLEITSAVPLRPIIAVYHYVRRARHPLKQQGKWHPDEDVKLTQAVNSLGQQWEMVAARVGRMAGDCRDRYRNHIVDRDKRITGAWSPAEEDQLTRIVTEMQKGKDLDNDVFWGKVTELMGGKRSRQQCRIKWTDSLSKKYKTDGHNPRWSARDAFIFIQKIDSLNLQDDAEINWRSIPDPQWNLWSPHTLQSRWLTMKRGIKGFEDMTHREIMDILRVKNADVPHEKIVKSAEFIVDSDGDDGPRPGSSKGPGTLGVEEGDEEEDSD